MIITGVEERPHLGLGIMVLRAFRSLHPLQCPLNLQDMPSVSVVSFLCNTRANQPANNNFDTRSIKS